MSDIISEERPVVLVGAGKMGGAMLSGWLNQKPASHFFVLDPKPSDDVTALLLANDVRRADKAPGDLAPSVVVVAVKPQMMGDVLPQLAPLTASRPVFVSVAAGTPVAAFTEVFGSDAAVVRAMPNTPAQVGRGITVAYGNNQVSDGQRLIVDDLLKVTGSFEWVDAEGLIDAVTAVSGSGPAYVFHMVEALQQAAEKAGLSPDLAKKLSRATVEGAGELLYQSDLEAETLRENVTSPGGTTAAALKVLMADDGLARLMSEAVLAAKTRAEELGS